ncbi:unnamed protein product [Cyclocybe aegerita]|uniref:Oxidation resistance protein 1 n=1 Tax=Cyclocybe aegerita TaxID=1973307 RepID=A0A8S0W5Y6_CYCAE|nr:unnamed protein product [Cyclocybe aegerita]
MAHPFDDLHDLAGSLNPLPSPSNTQSASTTPNPTPTQKDYTQQQLPQSNESSRAAQHLPPAARATDDASAETRERELEKSIDKFATLFSPSTPRASPVLGPTSLSSAPDALNLNPSVSSQTPLFDHHMHAKSHTRPLLGRHSRPSSIVSVGSTSSQSEFGSFVEVSALDDPLSSVISDFDVAGLPEPLEPTPPSGAEVATSLSDNTSRPASSEVDGTLEPPQRYLSSSASSSQSASNHASSSVSSLNAKSTGKVYSPGQSNPSLSFFDNFTQDARQRSSAARSNLLDELLMHEDDPMWFIVNSEEEKEEEEGGKTLRATPALPSPPPPPPPPKDPSLFQRTLHSNLTSRSATPGTTPSQTPPPSEAQLNQRTSRPDIPVRCATPNVPMTPGTPVFHTDYFDAHNDLDHDYFKSVQPITPDPTTRKHSRYASSPASASGIFHPTRANSMTVPAPTLAPPVSSQLTASPPTGRDQDDEEQEPRRPSLSDSGRSPSYQTLSSLPSKWMSSLLKSSSPGPQQTQHQSGGARPSLESIFNQGSLDASDGRLHHKASSSSLSNRNQSLPLPQQPPDTQPHLPTHSHTLPVPSSLNLQPTPTFTHNSPFAPSPIIHSASPFAPHVYIPPTGAPGFKGEGYDWDKGYSDELEVERVQEQVRERSRSRSRMAERTREAEREVEGTRTKYQLPERGINSAGIGSWVADNRGGWGSGLGFPFGSGRSKSKSRASPSPSSSVSGLGAGLTGPDRAGSRSPSVNSHERDYSTGCGSARNTEDTKATGNLDWQARGQNTRHDRKATSSPGPAGNGSGIGDFIERKAGNVELTGRKEMTTPVLTAELAGLLRPHLPALSRLPRSWTLIYSLDQHGISLNTLYTRCDTHLSRRPAPGEVAGVGKGMLVVMKDSGVDEEAHGSIFGAWIAEGIRLNKGRGYSGGGESFLWKYADGALKVFKTTGKNSYVALCEPDYLSFGGGDGHYGLYLDDTLLDGSSASCPTFDNEPLCSYPTRSAGAKKTVNFECVGLEVWAMGS